MVEVRRCLAGSRLVTLTGVGGIGKSRLALRVARSLERAFADGVWLVELAKLRDPPLLGETVATALGLNDVSDRDAESVLVDYLDDKRLLLVLDNCEHLRRDCASLTAGLLSAAPGLRVLVTSREPLGIPGECVRSVPQMFVPDPEAIGRRQRHEALTLFEQRAAAVMPGFTVNKGNEVAVARLCQRLDGLPLAIELAAVRTRVLTVEEILARLDDRFELLTDGGRVALPRHKTLRATVEWSFEMCSELERTLWPRLSVFAGDFTLEAAEAVCAGDGVPVEEVFAGVAGLVDKSVLTRGGDDVAARYRMLDTIRHYGRERLTRAEETTLCRRHRDYYLRLCEQGEAEWFGPHQVEWLNTCQAELPNLSAALEFSLTEPGEVRAGLRMAGALYWYWHPRAIRHGRRWLDRALTCDTEPSRERAGALLAAGFLACSQGDTGHGLSVLNECAALARKFDDETLLGNAVKTIGTARWFEGDLPEAARAHEQALAHYRAAGTVGALAALALCHFGAIVGAQGDVERAVALCQECIAVCEARGEKWARAWGLRHLAFARWLQGDLPQAGTHAKEALRLKSDLGDQVGIAWCVEMLAWVAAQHGDARRSAVLFGVTGRLWEQIGRSMGGWETARELSRRYKTQVGEVLGKQAFDAALRQGGRYDAADALAYALDERSAPAPVRPRLTKREREVATRVAQGMSNKAIAADLLITTHTTKVHIERILRKLGFTSRTQIASWHAQRHVRSEQRLPGPDPATSDGSPRDWAVGAEDDPSGSAARTRPRST